MRYFEIDFNSLLKINILNKETLIPPRYHRTRYAPEHILYAVTEGELHLNENGQKISLFPGDIYIFKKGDYHEPLGSTFCSYYYIHFETDSFKEYTITDEEYIRIVSEKKTEYLKSNKLSFESYNFMKVILPQKITVENKGFFEYFINTLKNNCIKKGYQEIGKRMMISNAVSGLFINLEDVYNEQFERKNKRISAKIYYTVEKMVEYIENNHTKDFHSKDVGKMFYINSDYANRIFKRIMGMSIIKYRNLLRINTAKSIMCVSDKTLSEIAVEVGFSDIYYFSRIFKKYEGITPGEYRNQDIGGNMKEDKNVL